MRVFSMFIDTPLSIVQLSAPHLPPDRHVRSGSRRGPTRLETHLSQFPP